jgi:hypothetical protein
MKPNRTGRFLMAAALLVGAGVAGAADKNMPPNFSRTRRSHARACAMPS